MKKCRPHSACFSILCFEVLKNQRLVFSFINIVLVFCGLQFKKIVVTFVNSRLFPPLQEIFYQYHTTWHGIACIVVGGPDSCSNLVVDKIGWQESRGGGNNDGRGYRGGGVGGG